MKKTMWKTTGREIRQSLGRYMAILAIVALGVSLFAGLKITKPFMLETAQNYLTEKNFYDFQLLSTYGFEAEDVAYLAGQPNVRCVQGSFSYDVLYEYGDSDATSVMKVRSMTEGVNGLEVVYGRLPQGTGECVVDSKLYGEEAIGQTLRLTQENDEDTLDCFVEKEFTIVGTVKSSLYIQHERGNTSLGTGKISGYMYVCPEAFDSEVFTEIYVKLNQDFDLYSDEYDAYIEEKEALWEEYAKMAAANRYQRVLNEANEELADAKKEFEEEKADAEAELADAKAELEDAGIKIEDAKKEIAEAKKDIEDAYLEIAENEQKLKDAEVDLKEGEQELADGMDTWNENNEMVESQKQELYNQAHELEEQYEDLVAMESMPLPPEQQAQIAAAKQEIEQYQAMLEYGFSELESADADLAEALKELEDGKQEIEDAKAEMANAKQKIADAKKELADGEQELKEAEAELADGEAEYLDGLKEYEDGLEEFRIEIADAEAEIADAEADIAELEEPESYVLGRDTNIGYVCLESDSGIVEDVSDVFPIFFFLVAALVCMTTMNRMVEEQRTQIGVLKALGYSNATIMAKYLIYSGSAALVGCVGGFFLGTYLFPNVIWVAYGMMYDMTSLVYYVDWGLAFISLLASLLCSMGVTWYSCRVELSEVAATLMRPKAPKAGKRIFLEYVPFIWKRLKFLQKVSIRNVMRYKKRFFMMIVGISGCTALLVAGFGIMDSVKGVIGIQYNEIQLYDMSVTFKDEPKGEDYEEFENVTAGWTDSAELFMETSLDLNFNEFTKSISLVVPQNPENIADYIDLHTTSGEKIAFPAAGEAVISHKIADDYGIRLGDNIELLDEDHNSFTVKVSGICENFVYNYVYLHPDTCRISWKEPEYKTAYLNVAKQDEDMHLLSAALMDLDNTANVTVNADVQERFETMMSSMNYIVGVIILCAAALAFIVLYNLTNINITERVREIATIKVLGFYKNETSTYVFRENRILTGIGAIVGLALGKLFHAFIMTCINVDMIAFDVRVKGTSYLYSFLLTFFFAWFVNLFMTGKIDRISMTESLKSVD